MDIRFAANERVELTFLIGRVSRELRRRFDIDMASLKLTRAQWRAMLYVFRLKQPTQTELAEVLELGRASVGSLIDQLERRGYVARIVDEKDRRVWRVVPTSLASVKWAEIDEAGSHVATEVFAGFTEEDLLNVKRYMEKVILNLNRANEMSAHASNKGIANDTD